MKDTALVIEGMSITRSAPEACLRLEVDEFQLIAGETAALTGPSGCGKSTFLDVLAMVLWPDSVTRMMVRLPENETPRDVTNVLRDRVQTEAARLRAAAYGYVLQQGGLFPFLTVRENLMVADLSGSLSSEDLQSRIKCLASKLKIERQLEKRPDALSVGERQRAAIVRALVKRPTVLLADEPTANLDRENSRKTLHMLCEEAKASKTAVFVVSHDDDLIREFELSQWRLETDDCQYGEAGTETGQESRTVVARLLPPPAVTDERRPPSLARAVERRQP